MICLKFCQNVHIAAYLVVIVVTQIVFNKLIHHKLVKGVLNVSLEHLIVHQVTVNLVA
jgi:hypothetical protein